MKHPCLIYVLSILMLGCTVGGTTGCTPQKQPATVMIGPANGNPDEIAQCMTEAKTKLAAERSRRQMSPATERQLFGEQVQSCLESKGFSTVK